jgi:hypothetical protein
MKHLSSYPNVYNSCLVWLRRDGFELSYDRAREVWFARKADVALEADNPIELIGLAALCERCQTTADGEYWWKIDFPDILGELDPE